jgi:hypothetical protein
MCISGLGLRHSIAQGAGIPVGHGPGVGLWLSTAWVAESQVEWSSSSAHLEGRHLAGQFFY